MQRDSGNGDGEERGRGGDLLTSMQRAAEVQEFANSVGKFIGLGFGVLFTTFFLPFLIVYAYNGLQPAVWPDISYLPTVAGLFVFRTLVHMVRTE